MSEREDIEMSFIRTLSVNGLILSGALSAEDRRERIRIAIFEQQLNAKMFGDELTFAQAYQRCYNRSLEMRRVARDQHQRPIGAAAGGEDETEDADDEEF